MGHVVNPNLYRLKYVIPLKIISVTRKRYSEFFDLKIQMMYTFITSFFFNYNKNIYKRTIVYLFNAKIAFKYYQFLTYLNLKQSSYFNKIIRIKLKRILKTISRYKSSLKYKLAKNKKLVNRFCKYSALSWLKTNFFYKSIVYKSRFFNDFIKSKKKLSKKVNVIVSKSINKNFRKRVNLSSVYLNKIKNIKFSKKRRTINQSFVLKSFKPIPKIYIKKNRKKKNIDNSKKIFTLKIKFQKKLSNKRRVLIFSSKNKKLFFNNFNYVPALKGLRKRKRRRGGIRYIQRRYRNAKKKKKRLVLKKFHFKKKNFVFKTYPRFFISNRFFWNSNFSSNKIQNFKLYKKNNIILGKIFKKRIIDKRTKLLITRRKVYAKTTTLRRRSVSFFKRRWLKLRMPFNFYKRFMDRHYITSFLDRYRTAISSKGIFYNKSHVYNKSFSFKKKKTFNSNIFKTFCRIKQNVKQNIKTKKSKLTALREKLHKDRLRQDATIRKVLFGDSYNEDDLPIKRGGPFWYQPPITKKLAVKIKSVKKNKKKPKKKIALRSKIKKFNKFFINLKRWQNTRLKTFISTKKNSKKSHFIVRLTPFFRYMRYESRLISSYKERTRNFTILKRNEWQIKKFPYIFKKAHFHKLLKKKIRKDGTHYVKKLDKKQVYLNRNSIKFIHRSKKKKRSRFYKFIVFSIKIRKYTLKKLSKYFKSNNKQKNKIKYIKKYIKKFFLKNKVNVPKIKKFRRKKIRRKKKKVLNVKKKIFYSSIIFAGKEKLFLPTSKNLLFILEPKRRKLLNKKWDKLFSVRQFFNIMINYNFMFKLRKFKKIFIKTFLKVLIHRPSIKIYFIVRKLWGSIRTADMFAEAIIMRLLKKNPIKIIVLSIVRRFKKYFVDGRIGAYAILFAGRFNRKDRAMYAWYRKSKYSRSNRIVAIDYSNRRVALKYSSCSLKISLIRSIFNNTLYEF